ncbi:hypothetical protein H4R18_002609 [Coemansia javaensis]|uniref:WD40 repeat-like protein n=1 Tax=Coemansia javaensis TaxID=2761396 RepID=A0A9W8LJT6_9FUNG|nr:hypothetical protein H4R18_002609 [Coemansia javaensis]
MDHRREELEKKRAKLAELRRQREERKRAATQAREQPPQQQQQQSSSSSPPPRQQSAPVASRLDSQDINDLVNSLVGDRAAGAALGAGRDRSVSSATSAGTQAGSPVPGAAAGSPAPGPASASASDSVPAPAPALAPAPAQAPAGSGGARPLPEFQATSAVVFDLPPREKIVYNKGVQTADGGSDEQVLLAEEEVERRVRALRDKDERARAAREEERARCEAEARAREAEVRRLTDEQRAAILGSGDFAAFVEQRSRVMERALDEQYDVMVDYTLAAAGAAAGGRGAAGGEGLRLALAFHDDKLSRNRSVADLAWSGRFPELVAAAYNRNPAAPNEPSGVVAVWNTHLRDRPEFVFYAPSDVLRVAFSEFSPSVLVGSAFSGQILLWDTRAKSHPVLKTPLTAAGHTHPVYALKVVGSTNAHQLITASTDGLVCSWQLDMLAQPQEVLELTHPAHLRTDEVSVTCMDFADNETAAFVVGTAEGPAYQVNRYDRAGCRAGLNGFDAYRAHAAPVTSLAFHPPIQSDFGDLFLTTSADWTMRLWRARPAAKPASPVPSDIRPLHVFDAFDDYVYDARWSPVHPAVLASADGAGRLALWNLNHDAELPSHLATTDHALNRLAWDRPGRHIAAGGLGGTVSVYDVGDLSAPRPDDHAKFAHVVAELAG